MVSDQQGTRLFEMENKVDHLYRAAHLAGMSGKTARKYIRSGQLPAMCLSRARIRFVPFRLCLRCARRKSSINRHSLNQIQCEIWS